jgi:CRP-like cAMP-binding protein
LNIQIEKQGSIFRRLAEGTLTLSSKKEYKNLITLFPDKADLKRAYADFLSQKGETETAYRYYLSAGDLYIQGGKTFQAIVSKILAWRIIKPTHQEGRSFHAALQAVLVSESPLQCFFADMPYPEFIATILRLVRVRIPAGETIIKTGDKCDDLYFIVSGELEETLHPASEANRSASGGVSRRLSDNDIFGEVFPLRQINYSRSEVKTLTLAELVKISKSALAGLSKKYPLIEELLTGLYKGASDTDQNRAWASVRRSARHMIPVKITLKITLPKQPDRVMNVEAISKDVSLGGVCVDLGLQYGTLSVKELVGSNAVTEVDLPDSDKCLTVNGSVVWGKHLEESGGTSMAAGIKFKPLDREKRDLLNVYCFGIDNEQALMWSLWETYMG